MKNNKLTWGWAPPEEDEEAIGLVIGLDDDEDDGDVELTDVTTVYKTIKRDVMVELGLKQRNSVENACNVRVATAVK